MVPYHASTADYLLLGDAGRFDAVHPEQSVLTVDPPSAFGFLDDTAAAIKVNGSYLKVPEGETLSLVGGAISLEDATLYAPGGEIDLVSVASSGEVAFGASGPGVDSFKKLGNINITRSVEDHLKIDDRAIGDVDVSGERGGVIYIRGGNFYVDGGHVFANTLGDKDSRGGIDIKTLKGVSLCEEAILSSANYGAGNAGNITIETKGFSAFGSGVFAQTSGKGNAGNIKITGENLTLKDGAQIGSSTLQKATGNSGKIEINMSGDVLLEGSKDGRYPSGVLCDTRGSGDGGSIQIDAENLFLRNGGGIFARVYSGAIGQGGIIAVNARNSVNIEGEPEGPLTGIWSTTHGSGNGGNISVTAAKVFLRKSDINAWAKGDGNAGDITVKTGDLTAETGYLRSVTFGKGNGGNITVDAENISLTKGAQIDVSAREDSEGKAGEMNVRVSDTLFITGKDSGPGYLSGLYCSTFGKGDGGNIFVTASNILIGEDGAIAANTHRKSDDAGNGGNIYITTEELSMKGNRAWIQSTTLGKGNAGDIRVDSKNISITDGAQISVSTMDGSEGQGGNIIINATGAVAIGGESSDGTWSGLFSGTHGAGDGGNITLSSTSLSLEEGGIIYASTHGAGDAGDILLEGTNMSFRNGAQVGASAREGSTGKGGNISVNATGTVAIGGKSRAGNPSGFFSSTYGKGDGGNIKVSASNFSFEEGGEIRAMTTGAGHGGKITVKADELRANGGNILTVTLGSGDAGDIRLSGTNLSFTSGSQVDASAWKYSRGNGGNVTVNAGGSVSIAGKDSAGNESGFFSGTKSVGDGGNISVTTGNLSIKDGGTISAESSRSGNAGAINIHARNLLSLDSGTIKTNSLKALGGDINITGKDIQLTHNSGISTSVKSGEGKGGNVTIDADTYVALENSDLTANADQGFGGDITINADAVFLSPDSDITASSQVHGKEGKISVNSPVQDIVNAMVPLRESFLKADELLPERCETRDPEQTGSFIVDSDEGLPPRPDELLR
jgi:large exoprotein involved in heme utilization and adhesion